ncbi:MAG: SusE domain-containing protein [Bacteroidota bacterium]
MKTNINKLVSLFFILGLIFVGCEDDDSIDIIEPAQVFQIDQTSASNIVLNFGWPDNPAFSVAWTDDITGSSSYTVEMSLDEDFTTPITLGTSSSNSFSMSVTDLNMAINSSGTDNFDNLEVYVRVDAGTALSNVVKYTVTAYPLTGANFTSPATNDSFVLLLSSSDDTVMTVSWEDALPSSIGSVDYRIEAALAGTDFAAPVVVGSGTDIFQFTATHSELNAVALGLGLTAETAGDVDMRIVATTTNNNGVILERTGDTITVSITPYSVSFPFLYLVGDATTPGWNNNNNNTAIFRNQDVPNNYVYTGYFNGGAFKLLEVLGQWQPQWGTNDGSTLAVNPGGGSDPGVFSVGAAGYYTYSFTTVGEGGTFTVEPYDASSAATYGSIAIIGSATPNGWDGNNDTDLNQDPNNPHLWYLNGVSLVPGEMLIRANDQWNDVWRYTGSQEDFYGNSVLAGGGDNIPFNGPAGTYDVWFNDLDGSYLIIPN